jgi:hypothetical protein
VKLPAMFTAAEIAKLLGWETQRARRWLLRSGAGVKRSGRVICTPTSLAAHFPEILEAIARERE